MSYIESGLYAIRARILALTLREHANDRAGRVNCDGRHERAVQTPELAVLAGSPRSHRLYAQGRSTAATRYPSGVFHFFISPKTSTLIMCQSTGPRINRQTPWATELDVIVSVVSRFVDCSCSVALSLAYIIYRNILVVTDYFFLCEA